MGVPVDARSRLMSPGVQVPDDGCASVPLCSGSLSSSSSFHRGHCTRRTVVMLDALGIRSDR
eukprot:426556-Heterocapsa_arctica.AAC.1